MSTSPGGPPLLLCIVPNPSVDKTAEVEVLRLGRPNDAVAFSVVPGGKGLNVARVAMTIGMRVASVVLLRGHAGRWLDEELTRIRMPHQASWAGGETRTCTSILDRTSQRLTEFYEAGGPVGDAAWVDFASSVTAELRRVPRGTLVGICGSFPVDVDPTAARRLASLVVESGMQLIVDTSGPHLEAVLEAKPFLVKVNAAEAASVSGYDVETQSDAQAAVHVFLDRGAQRAVVTRGQEGAVGSDSIGDWSVGSVPGGGPYSVGSGDAFLAGLALGLGQDRRLEDAIRLGAAAATANTLAIGQGNLSRSDVRRLYQRAQVQPLA